MTKDEMIEEVQNAFAELAADYPQTALSVLTGMFVGYLEYSIEQQGGDSTNEIKIDGCGKRDIIVCKEEK